MALESVAQGQFYIERRDERTRLAAHAIGERPLHERCDASAIKECSMLTKAKIPHEVRFRRNDGPVFYVVVRDTLIIFECGTDYPFDPPTAFTLPSAPAWKRDIIDGSRVYWPATYWDVSYIAETIRAKFPPTFGDVPYNGTQDMLDLDLPAKLLYLGRQWASWARKFPADVAKNIEAFVGNLDGLLVMVSDPWWEMHSVNQLREIGVESRMADPIEVIPEEDEEDPWLDMD